MSSSSLANALKAAILTMTHWPESQIKSMLPERKSILPRIPKSSAKKDLEYDMLNADTTSKLVYCDYPLEKGLNITFDNNKERRRNLIQFKIGLVTNSKDYLV